MTLNYQKTFTGLAMLAAGVGVFALAQPTTAHASDSVVNDYINSQHLQHAKIVSARWNFLPKNHYRHVKPEGVVVHETANPKSTLPNEVAYMKSNNNWQSAFVHSFVDAGQIVNIANTKYLCWGSGPNGNSRFVQFEQVEVHSKKAFAKEINNASYYTAYILKKYGLKPSAAQPNGTGTIWSHADVSHYLHGTDHTDPDGYYAQTGQRFFKQAYNMHMFTEMVQQQYQALVDQDAKKNAANQISQASQQPAASSSSTAPAAQSSTPATNSNSSSTPTTNAQPKAPKYAHVKYVKGSGADWANLSGNYSHYRTYNHVKNSQANIKKLGWKGAFAGKKVYIDMKGTKGKNNTWYRIRYQKSTKAKRYWVANAALQLSSIKYSHDTSHKVVKARTSAPLRSHVLSAQTLSKTTGSAKAARGKRVKINLKAIKQQAGKSTTWYRLKLGNRNYWITASATK